MDEPKSGIKAWLMDKKAGPPIWRQPYTEAIAAIDHAAMRRAHAMRALLDTVRRTVELVPMTPEAEAQIENIRPELTDRTFAVLAPYFEAYEALEAIIYASDGCIGHRNCAHSMEPWQRARKVLRKIWGEPEEV